MKLNNKTTIGELLEYGQSNGLSDRQLAVAIGMDVSHFWRWKNKAANAPDPRKPENLKIYEAIANLLGGRSVASVLLGVMFPIHGNKVKSLKEELIDDLSRPDTMLGKKMDVHLKKIHLINTNSIGNEDVLNLLVEVMQNTIVNIKKKTWYE